MEKTSKDIFEERINSLTPEEIEIERRACEFKADLGKLFDKHEINPNIPSWIIANYVYDSIGIFLLNHKRASDYIKDRE